MKEKIILAEGNWGKNILWTFFISQEIPNLKECSAVFCVPIYRDRIVLVYHPTRGWSFPGGHLEPKESLTDAVRREVLEETGLTIRNFKLFGYKKITHLKPVKHRDYPQLYPFPFAYIPYCLTLLQESSDMDTITKSSEVEAVPFNTALSRLAGPEKNHVVLKYILESKLLSS